MSKRRCLLINGSVAGSFWAIAWSPDSARVATAGGDKKVRIWDRESGTQVVEATVGASLQDMQVGITWASANRLISVALDGRLMCWDATLSLEGVVDGTQGPLNCLGCDLKSGSLVYGGSEGTVAVCPPTGPSLKVTIGKGIQHIVTHSKASEAWVVSLDDCVRRLDLEKGTVEPAIEVKEFVVGLGWLDVDETMLLLVTGKRNIHCLSHKELLWSKPNVTERRATSVAMLPGSPGKLAIALEQPGGYVGGVASNEFDIIYFEIKDTSPEGLIEKTTLRKHLAEVTAMSFNKDFLATGDAGNKILIWSLASELPTVHISDWSLRSQPFEGDQVFKHCFIKRIHSPSSPAYFFLCFASVLLSVSSCLFILPIYNPTLSFIWAYRLQL